MRSEEDDEEEKEEEKDAHRRSSHSRWQVTGIIRGKMRERNWPFVLSHGLLNHGLLRLVCVYVAFVFYISDRKCKYEYKGYRRG